MAARKKSKKRSNSKSKSFVQRLLSVLGQFAGWFFRVAFKPFAIKIYVLLAVLFVAYVVYLDASIRNSFEGKKWQLPARVYARPLELFQGAAISSAELETELSELGYQKAYVTQPGSYVRKGNRVTLHSRGYSFWDGDEPAVLVSVEIKSNRVSRLADLQGQPLPLLRLEPMEIGAIYPAHKEDRVLLRIEEVPPLLTAALLAVEDHRFYQHSGIAPAAIVRALLQNVKSGSVVQGGSTITQQLVKNYYLNHRRTLRRKFTEAIMALLLERRYEKEQILQAYLNEVYLGQAGDRAVHGFGLASQHYFNQPLQELSVDRLALLIAIVRGPTYYDPWRYPERAIKRRDLVIDAMVAHGLLQSEDADWARKEPLTLGKKSRSHFVFPAYIDLVKRQIRKHYDDTDLTSNGLKIYTSFDPLVQRSAEAALTRALKDKGEKSLQGAIVVTHPATGEVLAIVGGNQPRYAGFNRALDANRSIGSVVKPFVYLTALQDSGRYSLASMIDDSEIEVVLGKGESWVPRNFDRKSHGKVPMVTALAKSYNQATARLGNEFGAQSVVDTLYLAGLQKTVVPNPSVFIGTTQLTPFDVAGLYQTIAAHGYRTPLKAIRSVLDTDNLPLRRFPMETQKVWTSQSNLMIQHALQSVGRIGSARGAYRYLKSDVVFAGKTGTSGGQRDSWFAGFTGDLLAVVWMGYDDNRATTLTGSSGALPVWADFMSKSSRRSLQPLPQPGLEMYWIDWQTGKPSYSACRFAIELPFVRGMAPAGEKSCSREALP